MEYLKFLKVFPTMQYIQAYVILFKQIEIELKYVEKLNISQIYLKNKDTINSDLLLPLLPIH